MMLAFKKHIFYYICLLAILLSGIFLSTRIFENINVKTIIVGITSVFYIIFGILHHSLEHDLSSKIVIEYILMGTMGFSAVMFFLNGI